MSEFNPSAIMLVLASYDVSYVLIGGYAALLQGSGMSTIDIDIVPAGRGPTWRIWPPHFESWMPRSAPQAPTRYHSARPKSLCKV